jgi:hypothetical protein
MGIRLLGTLRDSKRALFKQCVSLYGSSVRGTWRKGSFTGNSDSYIRHVKEGFENGTSPSFYRLREHGGRAPTREFCETCHGRLLKQSISFIAFHKGNLRHLAWEGSANMFIGLRYSPLTGYNPGL